MYRDWAIFENALIIWVTVSCFCEHILQFKSSTCCCSLVFSYVFVGRSCYRRLVFTLYTMSGMFLHFRSSLHTSVAISLSLLCAQCRERSKPFLFRCLLHVDAVFCLSEEVRDVFWTCLLDFDGFLVFIGKHYFCYA